jgi:hypothetical protein
VPRLSPWFHYTPASSAVVEFLLKDALISPRQCSALKPLKFYNRKSKANRLSKVDDSLIAKAMSVISDQCSACCASLEVAHVLMSRV